MSRRPRSSLTLGRRVALAVMSTLVGAGCDRSPPPSVFPDAEVALERMRATRACSRAVRGEGKIDTFFSGGRVKASISYLALAPAKLRLDVMSPPPITASVVTLTSDGERFGFADGRQEPGVFFRGPANACNMSRFVDVPVPPFAMVQLLRGEAPVLVHEPQAASIRWEQGRYVVRVSSKHDAQQVIHLEPTPADWQRPWRDQRVRVLEVHLQQQGIELYSAFLEDYAVAQRTPATETQGPLTAKHPFTGPKCSAELPGRLRLLVPGTELDFVLSNRDPEHNPPASESWFQQKAPAGYRVRNSPCGG